MSVLLSPSVDGSALVVSVGDQVLVEVELPVTMAVLSSLVRRAREDLDRVARRRARPGGALFGEGYTGDRELLFVFDDLQAVHEYVAAHQWNEAWCPVLVRSTDAAELSVDDDGVWFEI